MFDPYKPQTLIEDAAKDMFIIETAIELAAFIELFKAKGFVSEVELRPFREKLRENPKFKNFYDEVKARIEAGKLYKDDPQAYLQMLMKAKMGM